MGLAPSLMSKVNFEDVQTAIKRHDIIISTLDAANQACLILGTISAMVEETVLNEHMRKDRGIPIIIYGQNATDLSVVQKYDQLVALGFYNVHLYAGGLFEWLLLQDVYGAGADAFPTTLTSKDVVVDLLRYKGKPKLHMLMLA